MQHARFAWPLRLATVALLAAGCLPSIADLDQGPLTSTFAVSDIFSPSGYMGDGEFFGKLVGQTNEGCMPPSANPVGNCYHFTYLPNQANTDPWAGVFWVFPSNQWGSVVGHAIDASKFNQIRFRAAVVGPSTFTVSGQPVPFVGQAGGINPNGRYANAGGIDFIDGVSIKSGFPVGTGGVTSTMQEFHIPLGVTDKNAGCQDPNTEATQHQAANCTGAHGDATEDEFQNQTDQAKFLIGAFAFALHYPTDIIKCANPGEDCVGSNTTVDFVNPMPIEIYVDDIVWDTEPPPTTP